MANNDRSPLISGARNGCGRRLHGRQALTAAKSESGSGPVVETASGKIRGVVIDKVYAFKGVPYGASTAGAGRFMPPAKPQPWTDIKDTTQIGHRPPQQPGMLERFPKSGPPTGRTRWVKTAWFSMSGATD